MVNRRPLIAGNWKMNFDHLRAVAFVQKIAWILKDAKFSPTEVEVSFFPPFTDIRSVQTLIESDSLGFAFGAQDVSPFDEGAHTGDISAEFLKKLNCRYVIIGHSERRQDHHENDELVAAKTKAALKHGLVPIICVGETSDDREKFESSAVPVGQLRTVLSQIEATAEIVIAYEPVWAIGSGQPATPAQAQEICAALRAVIAEDLSPESAEATRILYGGSVKSGNIASFMREKDVDGALVGGASLDAEEFAKIVQFPRHVIA
jgi:triosephosphate isomerase